MSDRERKLRQESDGWLLVSKKRSNGVFFPGFGNQRFARDMSVVTINVDNLSDDMDAEWLGQIFSKYGRVVDVFIPIKRSKNFRTKFGFVRFNTVAEAEKAIADRNGISIRDKKMLVKMASFKVIQNQGSEHFRNPSAVKKPDTGKLDTNAINLKGVNSGKEVGKSYADAVVGRSRTPRRISVNAIGNEWLTRSVIAKLNSLSTMESIREALHCKGVPQFDGRDMGGLWVVLTFSSAEQMLSVFDGELSWLNNWFVEVKKWSPEMLEVRRRNIWISCYGVPLHGWCALTFHKIAELWGEVIGMDEATTKGLSFAAGKVLIATEHWDRIDEVIHVEVKGRIFEVKVVEEQVVVHCHCSTCNLTFSESTRANSTQKGDDSAAVSVGEANSRREVLHGDWGDNRKVINDLKDVSRVEDSNLETLVDNLAAEVTTGVKEGELPIRSSSPKEDSLEAANMDSLSSSLGIDTSVMGSVRLLRNSNFDHSLSKGDDASTTIIKETTFSGENINTCKENIGDENIVEAGNSLKAQNTNQCELEPCHAHIQSAVKGLQGKKKRKNINDILGFTRVKSANTNSKVGRKKGKCVLFRFAVASAALSASISSEGINNRNRILLDEAQAIWAINKLHGINYDGDEQEVISKIAELKSQNNGLADCHL